MAHFRPVQSFAGGALQDRRLHIVAGIGFKGGNTELKGHF